MDMEDKWNKTVRERQILKISLICGILKNKLKLKKKQTHGYREQICDYQKQVSVWGRGVCGKLWEMSQGDAKVQTSSCKISPGNVIYSMVTTVNNTVLYI